MTTKTLSIEDRVVMLFDGNMRRIFAMKVTRSTYRELQNVILTCANQNKDIANFLFETLMTGQIKEGFVNEKQQEVLEEVIKNFTIPARLAKDVYERGDFINVITSDIVTQQEECALLNRVRRIDGEEFFFLSDPQNTVHLLQHYVARLQELQGHKFGKQELEKFKKELNLAAEKLKQMSL
jgi:hypothetical protein